MCQEDIRNFNLFNIHSMLAKSGQLSLPFDHLSYLSPRLLIFFQYLTNICSLVAPLCPLSLAAPLDWAGCAALKKAAAHQTSPSLHYHVSPQIACL